MGQREKEILRAMRDRNTVLSEKDLALILDAAGGGEVQEIQNPGFYYLIVSGDPEVAGDTFTIGPVTYEFQTTEGTQAPGNVWVELNPAGDDMIPVMDAINTNQGVDLFAERDQSDLSVMIVPKTPEGAAFATSSSFTNPANLITDLLSQYTPDAPLKKITYSFAIPPTTAPGANVLSVPIPQDWTQVRGVRVDTFSPFGGTEGQTGFSDHWDGGVTWDLVTGGGFRSLEIGNDSTPPWVNGDLMIVEIWGF